MSQIENFRRLSFLVYGLGTTGKSVVNFFRKNNIKHYQVWDDKEKGLYRDKRPENLTKVLSVVDFIVLSPGVSLNNSKNNKKLKKFKNKIITDIDLIFLTKKFYKSIVVTGTNGKSTTCKIINHILNKNKYKSLLGGNIGTPILSLNIKRNNFLVIEASSFQLSHSKFIKPDYALLLNITNDHLDWHRNMTDYINSKFKVFKFQNKNQFSLVNRKLRSKFLEKKLSGKLIFPDLLGYRAIKHKIKNSYLRSSINDENMSFVYTLQKLLRIKEKSFLRSANTFKGLPHRYEIFLKKKNCVFINDSKATTFESTKYALKNSKNIFWIVGGLPKLNDKINLKNLKKNIIKSYIIGKNTIFFKNQLRNQVQYEVCTNLKGSIFQICKDIRLFKKKDNIVLLSPASASFDQYQNFEKRGNEFKRLSKFYARKYL